jgi:hypothetical protein
MSRSVARIKVVFFQGTQQLTLKFEEKLSDLVQKKRRTVCSLETTDHPGEAPV